MSQVEEDETSEDIIRRSLFDFLGSLHSRKWWHIDLVRPMHPITVPSPFVISIYQYDEAPGGSQGLVDQTNQKETN